MNPALPSLVHELDGKRIAATAAAIAIHVLALMLMLAPMEWTPKPTVMDEPVLAPYVPEVIPPPPPPPPPPDETRPITQRPPVDVRPAPLPQAPPVISEETWETAIPVEPYVENEGDFEIVPPMPTGPVALTVLFGPAPPYPGHLQRMGVTGRVVLRIEVDASGHPVSGQIENSSGNRLLDKSALDWVVKKWRFEPAQHAGRAIASTALVPIIYSLQ